jgi:hypothetical protein
MSRHSEPDVIIVSSAAASDSKGEAGAAATRQGFRQLMLPGPEEQRTIISALEANGVEESLYVYTVSRDWYNRWRSYVGHPLTSPSGLETDSSGMGSDSRNGSAYRVSNSPANTVGGSVSSVKAVPSSPSGTRRNKDATAPSTSAALDGNAAAAVTSSTRPHSPPGPLEMDLSSEDDNMTVDEKVNNDHVYTSYSYELFW